MGTLMPMRGPTTSFALVAVLHEVQQRGLRVGRAGQDLLHHRGGVVLLTSDGE